VKNLTKEKNRKSVNRSAWKNARAENSFVYFCGKVFNEMFIYQKQVHENKKKTDGKKS
jgi:hypothetical protein